MEPPVKDRIHSSVRRPLRWTLAPAIAIIGVLAGLPAAYAADQQATDDEMSNTISWQAARGSSAGPYAQATHDPGLVYAPRHRSHR